ncbi:MAG: serine/threonine-protein kinase, partial [Gemmatimonadota bacterium]
MSGTTGAVCEKCGTAVGRGARFCAACGTEVSNPQLGEIGETGESTLMVSNTAVLKDRFLETLRDFTLGEYEILLEIGSGGMASVYLAHDIQLDRKVAIKAMHPQLLQGDGMVERFRLEARTVANLSHPNIVPIYAVKQEADLLLFVMKFIEGQPLDAIIKGQAPLPPAMVIHILSRVADALGYAHRHGVIHRDIKPANIMVDIEGHPVVTDFGIAKVANTEGLTMTGAAIGTPHYM